jgi:beta-lactamase class A
MTYHSTRRTILAGLAAGFASTHARAANTAAADAMNGMRAQIKAIEHRYGGRLGVAVVDSDSGVSVTHRSDERFPMCSTFKLLAAAAVLKRVDQGTEKLGRNVPYGPGDLLSYAPVTKAHVADGGMHLGDLCAAAIQWSDNTAANLMLQAIGGPAALTRYVRTLGDQVTRLDRTEPTLNTALPNDNRDTTSPSAMLRTVRTILLSQELSETSRRQLETWLIGDQVGGNRLRAGLPPAWRIGDKTGTGDNGTANVVAIIWPPDRPPILATVYLTGSPAPADRLNLAHADVGRLIASNF